MYDLLELNVRIEYVYKRVTPSEFYKPLQILRGYSNTPSSSCISDIIRFGAGRSKGIQKQCAAVFERSLWSHVATTKP
ncbi:MAG TPA: hypothetical protein VF623_13875, partial [Segetibacter sp.]